MEQDQATTTVASCWFCGLMAIIQGSVEDDCLVLPIHNIYRMLLESFSISLRFSAGTGKLSQGKDHCHSIGK
jgi:hypothetical protein